jgi:hypothetical protein
MELMYLYSTGKVSSYTTFYYATISRLLETILVYTYSIKCTLIFVPAC